MINALKLIVLMLLVLPLAAKEELIWLHNDFPPEEFTDPQMKGEGGCDSAMLEAQRLLTGYDHITEQLPFARFLKLMTLYPNYCYSCLLKKPERETFMHFSKPYFYSLSNMFVIKAEKYDLIKPYLNEKNEIDLPEALASGKIRLVISEGRSYGTDIDKILDPFKGKDQAVKTFTSNQGDFQKIVRRLVMRDEYHAILGFSHEISWNLQEMKLSRDKVRLIPIQGTELFEPQAYSYFGCSKTETGKRVIDELNSHIDVIRGRSLAKFRQWLDEDTKKLHEAYENEFKEMNP